ncbi:hypothetical protein NMG60_11019342 [Bertholletia excelsa]
MATQSAPPHNPMEEKPQNPALEVVQPTNEDQHDAKAEVNRGTSPASVFVNSEPIRQEQVQNAVKFLSHPKVRGSPVMYRRSFLERKGLTKEEIDEAFRLVPDTHPNVSSAQPASTNQDGQMKSSSNGQPQVSTQSLQPAAAAPAGVISKMGTSTWYQFRWSHAFLAIGIFAASGAGTVILFKNAIVPRLKSWIRKVVFEEEGKSIKRTNSSPGLEEEATAAAKAAAAAATDVARATQEILISKSEEKKCFEELMNLLGLQVQEMKSMSTAIRKLEARPSSPSKAVEPSAAPHPKSYMEILDMVQRGEKPPNIREINDLPPNPNQPLPNPQVAPRPKPWEIGHSQNNFSQGLQSQENVAGLGSNFQNNGYINQFNGESSAPWLQRKNVRITEIENEDQLKSGYYGVPPNEQPVRRSWVPPQPPPVAIPEAAAAIRGPKKPQSQKQSSDDDQMVSNSSYVTDELQRITKISELGGVVAENAENVGPSGQSCDLGSLVHANGGSLGLNTEEIQEMQEER